MKSRQDGQNRDLLWGLVFGILFGFFLQKGGVTEYDVIMASFFLRTSRLSRSCFQVVVTGMIDHLMKHSWVGAVQP